MTRLEIVVDELVVRGLSPSAARTAADALEARLTALAGEHPEAFPQRAEAFRRLPAIDLPAGSPAGLGDAVADAVWAAVSGGGAR
jgi:hypothetical protein